MNDELQPSKKHLLNLSLDTWAVLFALALVALVRFGVLKSVGW